MDSAACFGDGVPVSNDRTFPIVPYPSPEPLLGFLPGLDVLRSDWVIVGGELVPAVRPTEFAWVLDLCDQCR
jgi:protein gp37